MLPSELVNLILKVEQKLQILNKNSKNYSSIWAANRMRIYYYLAQKLNVLQTPHDDTNSIKGVLQKFRVLKYCFRSPLRYSTRERVVVVPHERKTIKNGSAYDTNSAYFVESIKDDVNVEIWDRPFNGSHLISGGNVYYLDAVSIAGKLGRMFSRIIRPSSKMRQISTLIENELNEKVSLLSFMNSLKWEHKVKDWCYTAMLSLRNVKQVYVVVGYGNTALISAAKKKNVRISELQHGVINKYHLGYHYPDHSVGNYFPDELLLWDKMWLNQASFPIGENLLKINKHNHLEHLKEQIRYEPENNTILIVSQGAIGKDISDFILKNYEMIEDKKIIYKLHPGEFNNYKENKSLMELAHFDKIEIITDEKSVYELFEKTSSVLGVFSTVLYEAIYFGIEVIILPVKGAEMVQDLVKNNNKAFLFDEYFS